MQRQKSKWWGLLSGLAVVTVVLAGCGRSAPEAETEMEAEVETIDLTEQMEIFEPGAVAPAVVEEIAPETVRARVGEIEVTQAEANEQVAKLLQRVGDQVPPERLAQVRQQMQQQVLDGLIMRAVLRAAIAAENITVEPEEVSARLEELTANFPEGMTLADFLASNNLDEAEVRSELATSIQAEKLIESKVGPEAPATEEAVRAFYDENIEQFEMPEMVTARHILIAFDEDDDEEARAAKRAQIEALREQLVAGADFSALAQEHSVCPSKQQGGSLGEFGRGQMVPEFDAAAFAQPVGEVGEVVETQYGYHLILVDEKEDARKVPFEEASERIGAMLGRQERQEAFQAYIEGLREGVEYDPAP
ncbi:MAG: peptidylprolyl isomerase [Candidatus Marinimicrobia bacterium]|nr:peptidylprolyl isomerase [Candidatus Neomarinimicrobiota bacterium]